MSKNLKWILAAIVIGVGTVIFILLSSSAQAQTVAWQAPVQISDTEGNSGGLRLVVDPQNTVRLIWSDWIDLASHPPYLQFASKGLNSEWTSPEFIRELGWPLQGYFGGEIGVVTGPDGGLHMVWEHYRYDNGVDSVTYIRQDVDGSWSNIEEVPHQKDWPSAEQPDIGIGPDGTVHVVYKDWLGPETQKTIQHVMRLPTGLWTAPQQVTLDEGDYVLPMLAVDDAGIAHLIYTENYTDHYEFYYAQTNTEGAWSAPMNMGVSPTPWNSVEQLTSGPNGRIHLVWVEMDQTTIPLNCAVKYSGKVRSGGWSFPTTIAKHCASQVSVAADSYGRAHVAWNSEDKLWYAYQSPEGNFTTPSVLDDSDIHHWGEGLSIAVDGLGGRHVAWSSLNDGDIWSTSIAGSHPVTSIITESGGSVYAFSGDTYVKFPSQSVEEDVFVTHTPQKSTAPGNMVGLTFFDFSAEKVSDNTPVTSFSEPYTMTVYYTDAEVSGVKESTIGLYWWQNNTWEKVSTSAVDTANKQVSASLDHMTQFAVLGEIEYFLNLPLIISETAP